MAVATIAHKPDLTPDQTKEIFRRKFEGKYKIEDFKGVLIGAKRDFMLVKNPFVAVAIGLEQTPSETKIVNGGIAPRILARALSGLYSLFLWNGPTNEVKEFIQTAPEFK